MRRRYAVAGAGLLTVAGLVGGPHVSAAPIDDRPAPTEWVWDAGAGAWGLWSWDANTGRWVLSEVRRPTAAAAALPADRHHTSWTAPAGTTSTHHLFTHAVTGQQLRGLVVYLDGDGQQGFDHPASTYVLGGDRGLVAAAGRRGYAVLAIRTPDDKTDTWWNDGDRNASYVADLTDIVRSELGVSEVWWVGFSGGAQLISQFLLPAHAERFPAGGALLTGGGGPPRSTPRSTPAVPMYWVTGTQDTGPGYNALADARRGQAAWASLGAGTHLATPAGVDHGDVPRQLGDHLGARIDAVHQTR